MPVADPLDGPLDADAPFDETLEPTFDVPLAETFVIAFVPPFDAKLDGLIGDA